MKTSLQVKQVVNYRVNLKAGEADNPQDKDGNTERSLPLVYSERRQAIEINVSDGWADGGGGVQTGSA